MKVHYIAICAQFKTMSINKKLVPHINLYSWSGVARTFHYIFEHGYGDFFHLAKGALMRLGVDVG